MKNETVTIRKAGGLAVEPPIVLAVQHPENMAELHQTYTDEEIISLVNRDEDSNIANNVRGVVEDALKANKPRSEIETLAAKAAEAYANGEKVRRTGATKFAKAFAALFTAMQTGDARAIAVSAEVAKAMQPPGDQQAIAKLTIDWYDLQASQVV